MLTPYATLFLRSITGGTSSGGGVEAYKMSHYHSDDGHVIYYSPFPLSSSTHQLDVYLETMTTSDMLI